DPKKEAMNTESVPQVHRWRAFALLVVAFFMTIVDLTIINVSLPTIGRALHFSESNLQWVVTAYAITFGGVLLVGGRAADLLGRRRILMLGLAIFTAASLGCGLARTDWLLIALRGLQGLGAAVVLPAALSIVMNMFAEGAERNKALGLWGAIGAAGATIGVITRGVLTHSARLGIHLLYQRADRDGGAAARPADRPGKPAGRCPPPLRPARRGHRDRGAVAAGLLDLERAASRLGVGAHGDAFGGLGRATGRLP